MAEHAVPHLPIKHIPHAPLDALTPTSTTRGPLTLRNNERHDYLVIPASPVKQVNLPGTTPSAPEDRAPHEPLWIPVWITLAGIPTARTTCT